MIITQTQKINKRTTAHVFANTPDGHAARYNAHQLAVAAGRDAQLTGTTGLVIRTPKWSEKHPTAAKWIFITSMILLGFLGWAALLIKYRKTITSVMRKAIHTARKIIRRRPRKVTRPKSAPKINTEDVSWDYPTPEAFRTPYTARTAITTTRTYRVTVSSDYSSFDRHVEAGNAWEAEGIVLAQLRRYISNTDGINIYAHTA